MEKSHPTIAQLEDEFYLGLKPSPRMGISEWADRFRVLSREESAEPGRWRTSRAEYLREIMDAIRDPAVRQVVWMKGAQVAYTASMANVLGYFAHQDPCPVLIIMPTVETAEDWSKNRLAPMLRDTPVLSSLFSDPKSRSTNNTLRTKNFPGGYLAIVGSNAPAGLASRPIRVILADEVDRWKLSAGTEGDPLSLAAERQTNFWNAKTIIGSTPGLKRDSIIEREYKQSDMRRFYIPCPHCREFQLLLWEQVKWDKTAQKEHQPETASYQCPSCGTLWDDAERWKAVSEGQWRATAPFTGTAGFHLSQLYSPWVRLEKIVRKFLKAQGNPEELKTFINTALGESWEEEGEVIEAAGLKAHIEPYGTEDLPDEIHYAALGGDVQADRIECEIVGWGVGDESWGVAFKVIYGDPARPETWAKVDEFRRQKFWTTQGRLVRVRAACFDIGGHHGAHVINYCRARFREGVYPIKGASGPRPVWPKRASKSTKTNENIWIVGVDTAKDAIYGRFKIKIPGPGYCHFPAPRGDKDRDYDDEWFEQVTSESVVTRYKQGRPYRVWVKDPKKRNEALDCRVYAFAARMSLDVKQTRPSEVKIDKAVIAEPALVKEVPAAAIIAAKPRGRRMRSKGIF